MTLVRWTPSPTRDLVGIQDEVNRLFDDFFGHPSQPGPWAVAYRPALDVEETRDDFIVRADLPGLNQKDVKVSLVENTLTIRGERKHEAEHENGSMRRVERSYGSFERSVHLDAPVRGDSVKATYRDGVLEIRVPKAEEAKVREIEVQAG